VQLQQEEAELTQAVQSLTAKRDVVEVSGSVKTSPATTVNYASCEDMQLDGEAAWASDDHAWQAEQAEQWAQELHQEQADIQNNLQVMMQKEVEERKVGRREGPYHSVSPVRNATLKTKDSAMAPFGKSQKKAIV